MRAAEKASSAAARDAAALEYTLGLDVCTDVAARKHVFFFFLLYTGMHSIRACSFACLRLRLNFFI